MKKKIFLSIRSITETKINFFFILSGIRIHIKMKWIRNTEKLWFLQRNGLLNENFYLLNASFELQIKLKSFPQFTCQHNALESQLELISPGSRLIRYIINWFFLATGQNTLSNLCNQNVQPELNNELANTWKIKCNLYAFLTHIIRLKIK